MHYHDCHHALLSLYNNCAETHFDGRLSTFLPIGHHCSLWTSLAIVFMGTSFECKLVWATAVYLQASMRCKYSKPRQRDEFALPVGWVGFTVLLRFCKLLARYNVGNWILMYLHLETKMAYIKSDTNPVWVQWKTLTWQLASSSSASCGMAVVLAPP